MKPRIGTTLASTVDATTVIVIRRGPDDLEPTGGGAPMVDAEGPDRGTSNEPDLDPEELEATELGKRCADDTAGVEVQRTREGQGNAGARWRGASVEVVQASVCVGLKRYR